MATYEGTFVGSSELKIGVIVARFNDLISTKLLAGCKDCLIRNGVDVSIDSTNFDTVWVPGSFELPIAAQALARSSKYDVLITLGSVIRGDTPHFDVVISEASKGISNVSRETNTPIIFGVLTTDTMQQALERAGIKNNLGWHYALQALEMGSLMRKIN